MVLALMVQPSVIVFLISLFLEVQMAFSLKSILKAEEEFHSPENLVSGK